MYMKNLSTNTLSHITYNTPKLKTTQIPSNQDMDKENVVYPYNGALFSHKKVSSSDIYYNMDEH
jgi:hypothetical protein